MRVETEHHVFEFDEPAGREGRELFRRCSVIISECGWVPIHALGTDAERAGAFDRFTFALAGHRHGERALFDTLGQGTMDGEPFTSKVLDGLPITHAKEPWDALCDAWMQLGFFGPGLLKARQKGAELRAAMLEEMKRAEETPTSD